MTEEGLSSPVKTRRSRSTAAASSTRVVRRKGSSSDLVDNLNAGVAQLIKENRRLRRQLEKLQTGGGSSTATRQLTTLARKVSRTLSGPVVKTPTRRRRKVAA